MTIFEDMDRRLYPHFERMMIQGDGGDVRTLVAGSGPPLLMLHGDPQTHLCWHKVAPHLIDQFTVVLTDIRGRGETHKPSVSPTHQAYSKRAMAAEQVEVMRRLGFDRFSVAGHDRGARVARRMALDHPEVIKSVAVMDIVPALDFYENTDAYIAQDYYYFYFLTQPAPNPERLISGDPRGFMREILLGLTKETQPYDDGALETYLQASTTPESISAMCECFRAGITRDCEDDRADLAKGRKMQCPTLVFWGEQGVVGRHFDMQKIWRNWADTVSFAPMPCGHFVPEEASEQVVQHLLEFLSVSDEK